MSSPFLGDILLRKTSTSMSSTRARSNGFISNLPDCKFAATNPKIRQFFCNEAPKKNYKNFYPKEKKEVPKRNDKKHEYKEMPISSYVSIIYSKQGCGAPYSSFDEVTSCKRILETIFLRQKTKFHLFHNEMVPSFFRI
ncbi:ATP-dependent zinc metalloprotease FTSH 3, mitochondrial [Glycine max]|nr:ATP-dependent zinc metalloprotease FTSH 3, mitochondrial [Glycine max]